MASPLAVVLVYEPDSGNKRPVPIARVKNSALARQVADFAINEAEDRASKLVGTDMFIDGMEAAEIRRLREVLSLLIPNLGVGEDDLLVN